MRFIHPASIHTRNDGIISFNNVDDEIILNIILSSAEPSSIKTLSWKRTGFREKLYIDIIRIKPKRNKNKVNNLYEKRNRHT